MSDEDTLKKAFELSGKELKKMYNLLTDVEQAILNVLIKEKKALSVKEIRNLLIDDFYNFIVNSVPTKYVELTPSILSSLDRKKQVEFKSLKSLNPTQRRVEAQKLLKNYGIAEIPSFQTIEKILNELVAAGLVIKRVPLLSRKTKAVYAANPNLIDELCDNRGR